MRDLTPLYGAALSTKETVRASYDIATAAIERGIPGDFVECGVFAGSNAAAMALAIVDHEQNRRRRVHLFDTFKGIPPAGPNDDPSLSGKSACPIEYTEARMREWGVPEDLLVWHPGLFADTIPRVAHAWPANALEAIAVLRLDGDLYASTQTALRYLYSLVSPGGWIIADDFGLAGCRLALFEGIQEFGPVYFQKHPRGV